MTTRDEQPNHGRHGKAPRSSAGAQGSRPASYSGDQRRASHARPDASRRPATSGRVGGQGASAPATFGVQTGGRRAASPGGANAQRSRRSAYGTVPPIYSPSDSWDAGDMRASGAGQDFQSYSRANYGRQMANSRNRGKRRLWTVVLVIASLVLVACLAVLGVIAWGYHSGTQVYDEVAQSANVATEADALADMTVDWDALLAQNPDTVAWIYMPGTSIDYPVVQGDSDEEYLRKDFAGNEGGIVNKGAIFLSTMNSSDFSDGNNFIYGHNMNDDTMFAHLVAMEDQATFDATRTFYVFTPTCNYRCTTLALDVVANTETSILQPEFADSAAMASYAQERIDAATAKATDVDLSTVTKLFTLITCGDDYATTRAVLFGGVVESAVPSNAQAADAAQGDNGAADASSDTSSGDDASADDEQQAA